MATLFQELTVAGCEIGNHESDLHVKDCSVSRPIIDRYCFSGHSPIPATRFYSSIDGSLWWQVCFHYDPFWEKNGIR